jgi:tetratricopeptide (TPR) repeat protein
MRKLHLVLGGVASLILGGCASVGVAPAIPSAPPAFDRDSEASAYGQFLAGQAAVNHGESAAAENYFGRATGLDSGPDQALLGTRTFTSALLAGDITKAAETAPTGPDTDAAMRHLGALVRGVEALSTNKPKLARTILTGPDSGAPNEPAAALLTPFAAAAAGDASASIVHPVIKGEPIAQFFANLDQGRLFERARRYDEAETAYRALIAKGDPGGIASLNLGEMLERRGRSDEAAAIYVSALAGKKDNSELEAARERVVAHRAPPPAPALRTSAAEALIAPATALLIDKQEEISLAYLRLALRLDPTRDEAWMLVGDVLQSNSDEAGARAAYVKVGPKSSQYVAARTKLVWSYQGDDDKATALATARETVAQVPQDTDAAITLADVLRANERYDESAKVLDGLIGSKPESPDWKLLYMRATDYEEGGRWADAERDLQAALKIRPDEPELLNFLGYSWIDRGVRLPEAIAMVQKAVKLQPQSGAMIDSLGWGYYRMGDFPAAVTQLEAAVVLEPGDPDVNNHLGDAYWRVGRRIEADFQWRRVLTLDPSAKLKAEVEAKLASGLDGGRLGGPNAPRVASK